jgi:hypothetical protein
LRYNVYRARKDKRNRELVAQKIFSRRLKQPAKAPRMDWDTPAADGDRDAEEPIWKP